MRLDFDDVQDLLARADLSKTDIRVYFALAALTVGLGRDQARVMLAEIGELAQVYDCGHVARSLARLAAAELYHHERRGQETIRWITWPPPVVEEDASPCPPVRKTIQNRPKDLYELIGYCQSIGRDIDQPEAQRMWNYYARHGTDGVWRDSQKRKVRDWHVCCENWAVWPRIQPAKAGKSHI